MKTFIKTILIALFLSFLMQSNSVLADDTELYVLDANSQVGVQPRVMIMFDNSKSMQNNSITTQIPFNATNTYSTIYWSTTSKPPSSTSNKKFNISLNNCNAAKVALDSAGQYGGKFVIATVSNKGKYSWSNIASNQSNITTAIDCMDDITNLDSKNPGTNDSGYPLSGTGFSSLSSSYGMTGTKASFSKSDLIYLFSEDYVTWYNGGKTQTSTRLAIAKKNISDLITSTPAVDYGLAIFNKNSGDSGSNINSDDGGRVVYASKNANDTPDSTDTNAGYRQSLINTVNSLKGETYTPLSETLYEIAHYWQGGNIWRGKWSGSPSYDSSSMNATKTQYISPFDSCHNHGYNIIITDGAPSSDVAANPSIENEYINTLSNTELSDWGKSIVYNDDITNALKTSYLPSLAGFLNHKDISSLSGNQTVTTYTIGFGEIKDVANAKSILEATAKQGGGKYFGAGDDNELSDALRNILIDILAGQYSMLAPTTASSTVDRSQYLNNLYYSIFTPGEGPNWVGNIKKLKYSDAKNYIVDKNDTAAISSEGKIMSTATTFWSSDTGDGASIDKGGVQSMLANKASRTVYTNNGTTLVSLNRTNLTSIAGSDTQLVTDLDVTDTSQIDTQISWILGKDVDGATTTANRKTIVSDMMHSKPLVINYGVPSGSSLPDLRILVGTNSGFLHMFKDLGDTVDESWAFIPYPLLKNQTALRDNDSSVSHMYGLDGTPVSYVLDSNNDGLITSSGSGDKAWVFVGQRQGGRSYYSFDVTNPNSPTMKWTITGGITTGFDRLGYTWSTPVVTKILGETNPILIFSGGYSGAGATNVGNAIYFVDANTGALKFKVSPDASSSINLQKTDMLNMMPGGVTTLDSDGDGVTDRLYVADIGGNVWRMDMGSTDKTKWSIFKFASLGNDSVANQDRRFFNAPIIVRTINKKVTKNVDSTYSYAEIPFDAVLLGSGDREYPASEKIVNNAYFMLRDYHIGTYLSSSTKPSAIQISSLYDITTMPNTSDSDVLAGLTSASGWVYWLSGTGEKVFGSGSVVDGTLYFTTFVPEASQSQDVCTLGASIGSTRMYEINMHYGTYSGNSAYRSINNLLIENLATYVSSNKKISLLGGPGDSVDSGGGGGGGGGDGDGNLVPSGTWGTTGTTLPKKEYQFIHED